MFARKKQAIVAVISVILAIGAAPAVLSKLTRLRFAALVQDAVNSNDVDALARLVTSKQFNRLSESRVQELTLGACGRGQLNAARILHDRGVPADFATSDGDSPLLAASSSDSPELVFFLLNHGCNPAIRDAHGNTPLSAAVWSKRPRSVEIAKLLLDAGAKPIEDARQLEPLKSAIRIGKSNMIGLLLAETSRQTNFTPAQIQEMLLWCESRHEESSLFLTNYFSLRRAPSP